MIDLKKYILSLKEKIDIFNLSNKSIENIVLHNLFGKNNTNNQENILKYKKDIKFNEKDGVLEIKTNNFLLKNNLFIKKEIILKEIQEQTKGRITEIKI